LFAMREPWRNVLSGKLPRMTATSPRPMRRDVALAAAVTLGLVVTACSSGDAHHYGSDAPKSEATATVLTRDTTSGARWKLISFVDPERQLCILAVSKDPQFGGDGQCAFGAPNDRMREPYDESELPDGSWLLYGPASAEVRRIAGIQSTPPEFPAPAASTARSAAPPSSASAGDEPAEKPCAELDRPEPLHVTWGQLPTWAQPGRWFVIHLPAEALDCTDLQFEDAHRRTIQPETF
jgi:hypothetical protein